MRPNQQRGQSLIVFALLLTLFFLGMIALVGDAGALYVAYNRLDGAALLAVQSAASAIDTEAFYSGSVRLDPTEAKSRCEESLASSKVLGDCSVHAGASVTAHVRDTVRLPIPPLGLTAVVQATRSAQPAYGGSTGAAPGSR